MNLKNRGIISKNFRKGRMEAQMKSLTPEKYEKLKPWVYHIIVNRTKGVGEAK